MLHHGRIERERAGARQFQGTWVLDASKTWLPASSCPGSATATIVQHGDTINAGSEASSAEAGVLKSHIVWGTDASRGRNGADQRREHRGSSVLSWENGSLVIRTSLNIQGTDVDQLDRWTLSADGKPSGVPFGVGDGQ